MYTNKQEFHKEYFAVVHGKFKKRDGIIESYLAENKIHRMYSVENPEEGKFAKMYQNGHVSQGFTQLQFNAHNLMFQSLLKEKKIKTISTEDAHKMVNDNQCNLIDIRDIRELQKEGQVQGANHIPRGMLEFWLDPESTYYQANKIQNVKKMVLFCALGWRSALATKSLVEMGFKNVAHVNGGFDALKKIGLKVITKEKK